MRLPKVRRNKNNASSAVKEKEILNMLKNREELGESKGLLLKHNQLRNSYINSSESVKNTGESPYNNEVTSPKVHSHQFSVNKDIEKVLMKSNFPARYSVKFDNEDLTSNVIMQESGEDLIPIASVSAKMTKLFLKFWNRLITKQDMATCSVLDHQLTDHEAGYFPCQLKTLFESPESYVKKSYCHRVRYSGEGHQFLPSGNHFVKIASRCSVKFEAQRIFDHFSNTLNQYYLIPIELSSKLSRCMLRSMEICQHSQGSNKIKFTCKPQKDLDYATHPIFTIEYKPSIELETLPSSSMSLVHNYRQYDSTFQNQNLNNVFWNFPHLSHFLHRYDFWIDDFYARCWHYSRFFSDKIDLGNRINNSVSILVKDSLFKFLVSCSARICVAIKYWVLNPEGATYFRCWCGLKIYDTKQESKILNKFGIGTAELHNFQLKLREQDTFHNKHGDRKPANHICACSQQFNDHKQWLAHIFSTKLYDVSKICPVFMYLFSQSCLRENRYMCECSLTFSDYDFWSFWLHACSCSVLKSAVKSNCSCNKTHKASIQLKRCRGVKRNVDGNTVSKRSRIVRSVDDTKDEVVIEDKDKDCESASTTDGMKHKEATQSHSQHCDDDSEDNWQSGDNNDVPLDEPRQYNFNNFFSKRPIKRFRNQRLLQ